MWSMAMRGTEMNTGELSAHDKAVQEVKEAIQAGIELVADTVPARIYDSDESWPLILKVAEMVQQQKNFNRQEQAWLQSSADAANWQAMQMEEIRGVLRK